MRYYDTSALIKEYLQEAGSNRVSELLKSGEKVDTAQLTYAETHAAFSRRTSEGRLPRETSRRLALCFDKDRESYDIVVLSENGPSARPSVALPPPSSFCGRDSSCFGVAARPHQSKSSLGICLR